MLFHTIEFFAFFAIVLIVFYLLPLRYGKIVLLAASYFFYICWNPKFIILIWVLTLIDYSAGLLLEHTRHRRLIVAASLCANLGLLGFFKYYNFFASSAAAWIGLPRDSFLIGVILPLGISFHTFQSMSYVIDVYRGEQRPIRNLLDYGLFIAFFPQLVAGPIVRARDFFRDLYHWRAPGAAAVQHGALLFLIGLTKKTVFADQFAKVSDAYFQNAAAHPGALTAWSAAFAFAMQIFFDFSGYTDMAIGSAKLLGFHFPENFARPYLAASITDFWRRWHMSLSSWLRDYLYIPLGGSRRGKIATYRNLMLTMLLGGLWHGANWTFILWGGWHGTLLTIERALSIRGKATGPLYPVRWLFTFVLVLLGWVLFRAPGVREAAVIYREMFFGEPGTILLSAGHLVLVAIALVIALLEEQGAIVERFTKAPMPVQVAALTAIFLSLEFFAVTGERIPFIYFQF